MRMDVSPRPPSIPSGVSIRLEDLLDQASRCAFALAKWNLTGSSFPEKECPPNQQLDANTDTGRLQKDFPANGFGWLHINFRDVSFRNRRSHC